MEYMMFKESSFLPRPRIGLLIQEHITDKDKEEKYILSSLGENLDPLKESICVPFWLLLVSKDSWRFSQWETKMAMFQAWGRQQEEDQRPTLLIQLQHFWTAPQETYDLGSFLSQVSDG